MVITIIGNTIVVIIIIVIIIIIIIVVITDDITVGVSYFIGGLSSSTWFMPLSSLLLTSPCSWSTLIRVIALLGSKWASRQVCSYQ